MDVSEADVKGTNDAILTTTSKPQPDSEDWILEPDTDRDVEGAETDLCMPIIQSITSLSGLESDEPELPQEEQQMLEGPKATKGGGDGGLLLSGDESDRLIIDMSASSADMDTGNIGSPGRRKAIQEKEMTGNEGQLVQNGSGETGGISEDSLFSVQNGFAEKKRRTDEGPNSTSKEVTELSFSENVGDTQKDTESMKDPESMDAGCSLVISDVQGSVPKNDTPSTNHKTLTQIDDPSSEGNTSSLPPDSISQSAPSKESTSDGAATSCSSQKLPSAQPSSKAATNGQQKHIIIIDPEGPEDCTDNLELINFQPGIIKLEPEEPYITVGATVIPTVSVPTISTVSTSAGLPASTSLSTATQQIRLAPSGGQPTLPWTLHQPTGPRTILRTPPKKPVPQVLVRHAGTRTRPSYIRLGSQTLQQIARLSTPVQPHPMSSQQRMISVLMDRSHNPITTTSLPTNFSQLLQAGPPGTLVNAGGTGNPLKVLIIPPQASSGGQSVTGSLSLANSTAPLAYSMTTTGSIGTLTSPSDNSNKNLGPTSEMKTASQLLGSAAVKAGMVGKKSGPGQIKVTMGSQKSAANSSKSSKSSTTEKNNQEGKGSSDFMQNVTATEDRLKRRLLSKTNLVKEYHPSLNNLNNVPFEFYSCPGCRDVFVNKSSLDNHKSRQSMAITYTCEPCKMVFTFTNKCMFRCHMLKHVQEVKLIHKNILDKIILKPMPLNNTKGKSNRGDSPCTELTEASPIEPSNPKESSPPSEGTLSKPKEGERIQTRSEPVELSSSLGITIASVSSVSLDDHQDSQTATEPCPMNKVFVEVLPAQAPPPLTSASSLPPPLPMPPSQPTTAVTDASHPLEPIVHSSKTGFTSALVSHQQGSGTPPNGQPVNGNDQSLVQSFSLPPPPPQPQGEGGNIFCTECSATFNSYVKLQKHFNDADKPHPLRAPCCSVRLSTECGVRAHMRMHGQHRPLVCSDCGECFRGDLAIFKKHTFNCKRVMESAVMVFPCPRCPNWYTKIDELRNHVRETHSESYLKCNLCPMAFKTVASFKEHNTSKHVAEKTDSANFTSIYKCPLCDSVFHDQRMKLEHLEQHINNIYANQSVSFVCQLCKKLCHSYGSMRCHLKEKHRVTALGKMCDMCGVDCGPSIDHLAGHQRKVHNAFPANMLVDPYHLKPPPSPLPSGSGSEDNKGSEDGKANKDDGSERRKGRGDPDDESMGSNGSLAVPQSTEQLTGSVSSSQKVGDGGENQAYHGNLPRASSMYNQPDVAAGETRSGSGQGAAGGDQGGQAVKCHICLQMFSNRKALVRHKKLDHGLMKRRRRRGDKSAEGLKRLKTDDEALLDETTPQFQVRSNFMLRFECDNCPYRTPTFEDLQLHQAQEHGIQARFPCHLCGITYQSMHALDEHMKATHEGQIREYPYLCWMCLDKGTRKGYAKRAHLVRHFITYHKVPSKAVDNDRLDAMDQKAQESAEEKLKAGFEGGEGQTPKRLKVDGEDLFTCVKCDFECQKREEFKEHIAKHKKGATESYQCPECGMCFAVLPSLKNHLRLVHRIKNFDKYLESSGVKLEATPPQPEKAKRTVRKSPSIDNPNKNPLECTVCYRVYSDETTLKNHMRNHGMAFIRSKRLAPLAFLTD